MKRICLLFLIFILGIWGCSNSVGPIIDTEQDLNGEIAPQSLHKKQDNNTPLSVSGLIKSKKSSELIMDISYELDSDGKGKGKGKGKKGKKIEVYAKIQFPAKAVDKDEEITMTFDPEAMMFTFSPAMLFNKDAKLEVKLKGLDLKGVKKGDVEFVYKKFESEEYVKHSNIGISSKKGELKVANLKIRHFSRFGFVIRD